MTDALPNRAAGDRKEFGRAIYHAAGQPDAMTDQDVITILSRRHVEVLEELEHARRLAVLLEQNMAMETAAWRRNMPQTDLEIQRRGYAIYDGPHAEG